MQDTRRFKLQHCIRLPRLIRGPARSEPVRIERHGPQVVFGPLQPGSQNPPCHSRNCSILRRLRPLAVSPANRTMMPTVRNPKLMAMPLIRSREMRCMNSKNPMSNLRMARMTHPSTRPRRNARGSQSPLPSTVMCLQILCLNRTTRIVPESDDEDRTQASRLDKSQITRPRVEWEHVSSWSRKQVSKDDYEGEIARIMAKSLQDAKHVVTPKYNPRAISDFRFKTVSPFRFLSMSFVSCSVIFC